MASAAPPAEGISPAPPQEAGFTPAPSPDHSEATLEPVPRRRAGVAYVAVALLHLLALVIGGGLVVRRWFQTLYHLRADSRAEPVYVIAALSWPLVLGFVLWCRVRPIRARWALLAVLGWTALLGAGLGLFERSLQPPQRVTIEGAPLDPSAPPAAKLTEHSGAPVEFAWEWQQGALPGQTFVWNGLALRLTEATLSRTVPGLPAPAEDGEYLVFTLEATGRAPYGQGWPGERTAMEVTIDEVRIVPKEGWSMGVPAEPQSPGWLEVDGAWVPYGPNDLRPQLPIPAPGETVTRRFAAFVPVVAPVILRYDHVFVTVHPDVEDTCRMRPPDIERRCTWLAFPWEIPKPSRA